MKRLVAIGFWLLALAGMAQPATAQDRAVSGRDPETVRRLFDSWGYRTEPMQPGDSPLFLATVDGIQNAVVFGGCTAGRNCSHIVLIATYNDVPNPPHAWLNQKNFDYNLVTVMRRDDGLLTLRMGIMLGAAGIPASVLREAIGEWIAANDEIARAAVADRLDRN